MGYDHAPALGCGATFHVASPAHRVTLTPAPYRAGPYLRPEPDPPLVMATEQIAAFVKLYLNDARPLQPLNKRIVKQSQ